MLNIPLERNDRWDLNHYKKTVKFRINHRLIGNSRKFPSNLPTNCSQSDIPTKFLLAQNCRKIRLITDWKDNRKFPTAQYSRYLVGIFGGGGLVGIQSVGSRNFIFTISQSPLFSTCFHPFPSITLKFYNQTYLTLSKISSPYPKQFNFF